MAVRIVWLPTTVRGRSIVKAKRWRQNCVRLRVPLDQTPFVFFRASVVVGFVSLMHGHGRDVDVDVRELRDLIAGSRGSVIVARQLLGAALRLLQSCVDEIAAEVHGRISSREELRLRRSPQKR